MNSEPKISVIIPVYNVKDYLRAALDSVINQTYKNLEIIAVDDASLDCCYEILLEYKKKDDRIKIVKNEKNVGLGLTRNNGLKVATGDYIHYFDSDDYLELNCYFELVKIINENKDIDVIHFRFREVYPNSTILAPFDYKYANKIIYKENSSGEFVKNWLGYAWCAIYRHKFLVDNNIIFNDYPCLEDQEHSIKVLASLNTVYFSDKILLNYRRNRAGSLLTTGYKHYMCALNSLNTNIKIVSNFPLAQREFLLEKSFQIALSYLRFAYLKNFISFDEYKKNILSLDYSLFTKPFSTYSWYVYYHELKKYPDFLTKIKLRFQFFLKTKVNFLYNFLRKLKASLKF